MPAVGQADGEQQLGCDAAGLGQLAAGELVVAQLDEGVGQPLGAGALIAGGAVGLGDGFDGGLDLLPADRVELEPAGQTAVRVLGQGEGALFGGVGFGAVGVEVGQVAVHRRREVLMRPADRPPG